jgi:hypothetical protein
MGDIVNLRDFRKARARAEAEARAAENRARFGRSKGERVQQANEEKRVRRELDNAKLERPEPHGSAPPSSREPPLDDKA